MKTLNNHILSKSFMFDNSLLAFTYEEAILFFVYFIIFILLVSFYFLGPFNITNIFLVFFLQYKSWVFPLYLIILFVLHIVSNLTSFFNLLSLDNFCDYITNNNNIYKEFVHNIDMYKDSDNESDSTNNEPEEDIKNFSGGSSNNNNNDDDKDDSNKKSETSNKRKFDETDDNETVEESSNKKHKLDESELTVPENTDTIDSLESDNESDSTNLPESNNESNSENLTQVIPENQVEDNSRVSPRHDTHNPSSENSDSDNNVASGEDDCGCNHRGDYNGNCTHTIVRSLSNAGGLECCYCRGQSPDVSCNSMSSHCSCVFHLSCLSED